jgi:hypothetical protein
MAERIVPPRRGEILTNTGFGTTRLHEYLERLTGQTNDSSAAIEATITSSVLGQIASLNERLGSGQFLTSDDTGFTVDSDVLFVDMTEA